MSPTDVELSLTIQAVTKVPVSISQSVAQVFFTTTVGTIILIGTNLTFSGQGVINIFLNAGFPMEPLNDTQGSVGGRRRLVQYGIGGVGGPSALSCSTNVGAGSRSERDLKSQQCGAMLATAASNRQNTPSPPPSLPNCDVGSYSTTGKKPCTACPSNSLTYKNSIGAVYYENSGSKSLADCLCQKGFYGPGGKPPCTACPTDTTTLGPLSTSQSACVCPSGTYGPSGKPPCTRCSIGSFSSAGASSCTSLLG